MVSRAEVAAKILKRGNLQRRTNFLPLDKMNAHPSDKRTLEAAQSLVGRDNVWRAIDLVEYDPVISPALEFVLGGMFICSNLRVANELAYNKKNRQVNRLCITLDGDKVNPSGELSGGQ